MGLIDYCAALARVVLLVGMAAVAGVALRGAVPPSAHRAARVLESAVLGLAAVVLSAQLLGAFGWLSYWPLLAAVSAIAGAAVLRTRRAPARAREPRSDVRFRMGWLGILALLLVVAVWTPRVVHSYRFGIQDIDTLRYHAPLSAEMASSGSAWALRYLELDHAATVAPSNNELVGAVAVVTTGNDVLLPLTSLFWLALALLGGWTLGARLGSADAGLAAVALTAIVPLSAITAPGSAKNDIAVLGLVVACVAAVPSDRMRSRGLWVAAIAGGLAVGTKLTAIVPVATVVLVVAIAWRGARRSLLGPAVALLLTGGFWFARNIATTGSIVPASNFSLGPLGLSGPTDPVIERTGFTILDRAGQGHFWRGVPHGLDLALGPGWALILAGAAVAVAAAVWRGPGMARIVAVVAAAGAIAHLVTPYSAGGPLTIAWLFPIDLRFAFPALALALIALQCLDARHPRWLAWALAVALVTPLAASHPVWRARPPSYALVGVMVALTTAALILGWRSDRRKVALGLAVLVVAGAVAGYWGQREYFDRRYREEAPYAAVAVNAWAQDITDARIGVVGLSMYYPLYGRELDNEVDYLGIDAGNGTFRSYPTCRSFLAAVARGRYDYLVVGDFKSGLESAPERAWAAVDHTLEPIVRDGPRVVFRVDRDPDPTSCRRSAARLEPLPPT